ncbi:MAG TPA: phosphodiester glycosidase family protein [Gemmatimonadaceae bacterium]|nr:phosphodiester glycosidase family protein [Gemmatimonadaceae bacterium]
MTGRIAATLIPVAAMLFVGVSGVSRRELPMAKKGALSHVRAIVITIDPVAFKFRLDLARKDQRLNPAWTIDSIPQDAVVAVNAGQFIGGFPWGWLVRDGIETQPPGMGSLGMAFIVDSSDNVSLATQSEIPRARGHVLHAFQSYPALLVEGEIPWELQEDGRGVNLLHRDSRLALCITSDGKLTIALTRVTALGSRGATLPYGPTIPEMALYMRSLGCNRAMLLDGGLSSQLAVRDDRGRITKWTNWRMVPLGLVVLIRAQ